jgi:hypothetical protein
MEAHFHSKQECSKLRRRTMNRNQMGTASMTAPDHLKSDIGELVPDMVALSFMSARHSTTIVMIALIYACWLAAAVFQPESEESLR